MPSVVRKQDSAFVHRVGMVIDVIVLAMKVTMVKIVRKNATVSMMQHAIHKLVNVYVVLDGLVIDARKNVMLVTLDEIVHRNVNAILIMPLHVMQLMADVSASHHGGVSNDHWLVN